MVNPKEIAQSTVLTRTDKPPFPKKENLPNEERQTIGGLIIPMFTPLVEQDGNLLIDDEAAVRLVDRFANAGAGAVFILGNAGKFDWLTREQKQDLIHAVIPAAEARQLPVLVGVSAATLEEITFLSVEAEKLGADGLVLLPLYGASLPEEKIEAVLGATNHIPLILYNNSFIQNGESLSLELIKRYAEHPRVIGIKEGWTDAERFRELLALQSPSFKVYLGDAGRITEVLRLVKAGELPEPAGFVPVQANLDPNHFSRLSQDAPEEVLTETDSFLAQYAHTMDVLNALVQQGAIDQASLVLFQEKNSKREANQG